MPSVGNGLAGASMLAPGVKTTYAAPMRLLALLLATLILCGCASTALADPVIHVSPYLAIYELRGKSGMQSVTGGGPGGTSPILQNNATQAMRRFGQDRSRDDVGIRADIGDGFGGIRAEYYRLDMNTTRSGTLEEDWGQLRAGDEVNIYAEMDELRVGFIEPLSEVLTEYRDDELRLKFGAGGLFATRQMSLHGKESSNTRTQNLEINGDLIYLALRAQATWRDFSFDVDYAIAPELLALSGDFEDLTHDFEARISYQMPQRDMTIFAGVRYSEFAASGTTDGYGYKSDLTIDGFQLGVSATF